jgi:hypothetical protein
MLEKAFESLGAFPLIQASVALLILMAGYILIPRGEKDGKQAQRDAGIIPQFLMMGPAHDAIGAIHEMNEQSRQHIALMSQMVRLLEDIAESNHDLINEAHRGTGVLEAIRNESRLR